MLCEGCEVLGTDCLLLLVVSNLGIVCRLLFYVFHLDETAAYCDLEYTGGSCKYVCDPETEPDHVYGLCSGGRWCCYKNFMGR